MPFISPRWQNLHNDVTELGKTGFPTVGLPSVAAVVVNTHTWSLMQTKPKSVHLAAGLLLHRLGRSLALDSSQPQPRSWLG